MLIGAPAEAEEPPALRAGVAKQEITPAKPVTLAGYASRKDLSQGVHDPLAARVVAFEQGGKRLVLVAVDVLGFYGGSDKTVRQAILEGCRLAPSELFLSAIHTHAAPSVTLDERAHANNLVYTQALEKQLVGVIREALAKLAPAQIAVGIGASPVGVNRREPVIDANGRTNIVLGRNPGVLTDREVQVLRVSRAGEDDPTAVLFAYPTHSTAMGPGNYLISGDIHGLAEQFIEKHVGKGLIAPAFAGASGDIDPWFRVVPKFDTANGWVPEAELMGTMLGEEVVGVSKRIKQPIAPGPVTTAFKTFMLPGKPEGENDPPRPSTSHEVEGKALREAAIVPLNLTVGRVGDVAFVGLGGEIFNAIGREIKSRSPFKCTLVITHCNGSAGYLPTKDAYAEGGYEVRSSRFGPAAADDVIREVVRMLRELEEGP